MTIIEILQLVATLAGVAVMAIWASVTVWAIWALRHASGQSWLDAAAHIEPRPSFARAAGGAQLDAEPLLDADRRELRDFSELPKPAPGLSRTAPAASGAARRPCTLCAKVRSLLARRMH